MSYEERGQWVYVAVTVVAYGAYLVLLLSRARATPLADVAYAPLMLWTIVGAIVASIVGRIILEIVAHSSDGHSADVRDRDIGRLGEYVGGTILGIGMVGPFALTLLEADHFWIANGMYLVFVLAAVVGTAIKLIAYRRGF